MRGQAREASAPADASPQGAAVGQRGYVPPGGAAVSGSSALHPKFRHTRGPSLDMHAPALKPRDLELQTGLALTWLGTNSGSPTLSRNVSCTVVRTPGAMQIVDCGEGSHRQLLASGLPLHEVDG